MTPDMTPKGVLVDPCGGWQELILCAVFFLLIPLKNSYFTMTTDLMF
jgi:hypothetical protein